MRTAKFNNEIERNRNINIILFKVNILISYLKLSRGILDFELKKAQANYELGAVLDLVKPIAEAKEISISIS